MQGKSNASFAGWKRCRNFLNPKDVTLQTLLDEQAETTRVAKRIAIFDSWANCGIDELIDTLTERRIHKPMDIFHGSSYIVNRIQCPHCYHGYVAGISDNYRHIHACAECLGLGHLPKAGTLS